MQFLDTFAYLRKRAIPLIAKVGVEYFYVKTTSEKISYFCKKSLFVTFTIPGKISDKKVIMKAENEFYFNEKFDNFEMVQCFYDELNGKYKKYLFIYIFPFYILNYF